MAKKSKRYSAIMESFDKTQTYDVAEAVKNVKSFANAKFDETVEMHIRLGVDGRHADQQAQLYFHTEQVRARRFLFLLRVLRLKRQRQLVQIT